LQKPTTSSTPYDKSTECSGPFGPVFLPVNQTFFKHPVFKSSFLPIPSKEEQIKTFHLDHDQYTESIAAIDDEATYRFALQAQTWWSRHYSWKQDGCRVLTDNDGTHLAYLFYKVDRYRDCLTLHNLFTPKIHRNRGFALAMLKETFLQQAEREVKRFRMSCTPESLGFYARLALIYWGVDSVGNYHCDLPLPKRGIAGIADMVQTRTDRTLLGTHAASIYKKVMADGAGFEAEKMQQFRIDRRKLAGTYRHEALKTLLERKSHLKVTAM
jgi:predicted GNAT family acetyltransferase